MCLGSENKWAEYINRIRFTSTDDFTKVNCVKKQKLDGYCLRMDYYYSWRCATAQNIPKMNCFKYVLHLHTVNKNSNSVRVHFRFNFLMRKEPVNLSAVVRHIKLFKRFAHFCFSKNRNYRKMNIFILIREQTGPKEMERMVLRETGRFPIIRRIEFQCSSNFL